MNIDFIRALIRQPVVVLWLSCLVMDLVALAMTCLALRDIVMKGGR